MKSVLDDTFLALVNRLCSLDDQTSGHPQVAAADRPPALAGLERILLDTQALNEHIRSLQKRFGRTFRHQALLPEERAERIVSGGASALSNDELAVLLLNPIASRDLAFRIQEALPDYWLERMSEVGRQVMQAEGIARKPKTALPALEEQANGQRSGGATIQASAWNDGANTYGIRVGIPNRKRYFDPVWREIEVEIEGEFHRFALTSGFWRNCPEFRDRGEPIIREWLRRHRTLDWPKGEPPQVELVSLGGRRFRLVP